MEDMTDLQLAQAVRFELFLRPERSLTTNLWFRLRSPLDSRISVRTLDRFVRTR